MLMVNDSYAKVVREVKRSLSLDFWKFVWRQRDFYVLWLAVVLVIMAFVDVLRIACGRNK
jgi:hypothetical protein